MAEENNHKTTVAVWRGGVDQKLTGIKEDVGFIREEIGRMCQQIHDNTIRINKQRVLCDERVRNIDAALGDRKDYNKTSLGARVSIAVAVIMAAGAILAAVLK